MHPSVIGPYRVLETIGQGGMGVVYRAEHEESRARVAVKTVRVKHHSLLSGIRREIRALMRVAHPGVVRILGEGVVDGVPWYAMELLEGRTLRDFNRELWSAFVTCETEDAATHTMVKREVLQPTMKVPPGGVVLPVEGARIRSERLPAAAGRLGEALAPVRQLCETLAFLHGEGIVHRDLKPDNVFLRDDGAPVLMDFGIVSRFGGSSGREVLEVSGYSTGTAGYMAPEQIHGERVDARADLYAVGCMLYELTVGLTPFPGSTGAVIQQHLTAEAIPPSLLVDKLPIGVEQLIQRLLAKRPRDRLGHADDVVSALDPFVPDGKARVGVPRSYLYRPDLVGRDEACTALDRHLADAKDGRGALVLVGGESGVGKTSLAAEAARMAAVRGMQVMTGECVAVAQGDGPRGAPFHPFRELLQNVADRCLGEGRETFDRLLGPRAKVLAAVEPTLGRLPDAAAWPDPPEVPAEAARRRLFSSLAEVLAALTDDKPLLLVLDDLHWADELTLAFLQTLLNSFFQERRLLVLGTYRSEEKSRPIDELCGTLGTSRIDLGRLPPAIVKTMIAEMLALHDPPDELVQVCTQNSEGNPFFVAEYLRAAVGEGILRRDDLGRWQLAARGPLDALKLPGSLRELVGQRLAGLSEAAQLLCEAAAVLGRSFDGELPERMAPQIDADSVIDELIARSVLEPEDGGRLRFVHDKLREVAYARIDEAKRTPLHQAAALAIEARFGDEELPRQFATLAHHWANAGFDDKALDYLERTGDRALRSAAYGEAADAFSRALALDEKNSAPRRRRARWEHGLGRACFGLGDMPAAEEHLRRALELFGQPLPSTKAGWVGALLSQVARQAAHRAGLTLAPRDESKRADLGEAAKAASLMTYRLYVLGDSLGLIGTSLRAINLAETARLAHEVPRCYSNLGYIAGLLRRHALARDYFSRAQSGAEHAHDRAEESFALCVQAVYDVGFGRWFDAEKATVRAIELARLSGDPQQIEIALTTLGHIEFYTGRFEASHEHYAEVLRSARARKHHQHATWALFAQARSLLPMDRVDDALPLLVQARRALEERPELDPEIMTLGMLAVATLRRGDAIAARGWADETLARMDRSKPIGFSTLAGYDGAAQVYLDLWSANRDDGELARNAKKCVKHLGKLASLFPMAAAAAHLRAGQAALLEGKRRRAARQFQRSLEAARALGMPRDESLALLAQRQLE